MCNLYSITTNQAAIIALFRVINHHVGNLPPMPGGRSFAGARTIGRPCGEPTMNLLGAVSALALPSGFKSVRCTARTVSSRTLSRPGSGSSGTVKAAIIAG